LCPVIPAGHVAIHVHDAARKCDADFVVFKPLLLRRMRYFERCIPQARSQALEDMDIAVHCDVHVFAWLLSWAYAQEGREPPGATPGSRVAVPPRATFTATNVVPVIISAEFLRMDPLVQEASVYIARHLQDVVTVPLDLSCISKDVVARIAAVASPASIARVEDPKGKLVPRLAACHIQELLVRYPLLRCAACGDIYTAASERLSASTCASATPLIDYHGHAVTHHTPVRSFDAIQYAARLRGTLSAREAYWHCWGMAMRFRCDACGSVFSLARPGGCRGSGSPYLAAPLTSSLQHTVAGSQAGMSETEIQEALATASRLSDLISRRSGASPRQSRSQGDLRLSHSVGDKNTSKTRSRLDPRTGTLPRDDAEPTSEEPSSYSEYSPPNGDAARHDSDGGSLDSGTDSDSDSLDSSSGEHEQGPYAPDSDSGTDDGPDQAVLFVGQASPLRKFLPLRFRRYQRRRDDMSSLQRHGVVVELTRDEDISRTAVLEARLLALRDAAPTGQGAVPTAAAALATAVSRAPKQKSEKVFAHAKTVAVASMAGGHHSQCLGAALFANENYPPLPEAVFRSKPGLIGRRVSLQ
jgi:hypothetical protein